MPDPGSTHGHAPHIYLIDDGTLDGRALGDAIMPALPWRPSFISLHSSRAEGTRLAAAIEEIVPALHGSGARVLLASTPALAIDTECDGVQLPAPARGLRVARSLLGPERVIALATSGIDPLPASAGDLVDVVLSKSPHGPRGAGGPLRLVHIHPDRCGIVELDRALHALAAAGVDGITVSMGARGRCDLARALQTAARIWNQGTT